MATMVTFHVPNDKELLAAFGEMALRHEHLNYILRMTIKTLGQVTTQEALDATVNEGSRQLRERIRKLARQRLGEGPPLLKLQALMRRCQRVTDKRNELVHSVWAKELDGEAQLRSSDHTSRPLPTRREVSDLSNEIRELTTSLNQARLEGFLQEALAERKNPSASRLLR
jgi:HAMP domain-containing protein